MNTSACKVEDIMFHLRVQEQEPSKTHSCISRTVEITGKSFMHISPSPYNQLCAKEYRDIPLRGPLLEYIFHNV